MTSYGALPSGSSALALGPWNASNLFRITPINTIFYGNAEFGGVPSAVVDIYSATSNHTNTFRVRSPWPSVRLDGTGFSNRIWTILTGGLGAQIGYGAFGIWDDSASAYRLAINTSGNVGIGVDSPRERLDVTGNIVSAWGDRRMGVQFLNGSQFFFGMETSTVERNLKITARSADIGGVITFNTGSAATERARITNNRFTINNSVFLPGTPPMGVEESPMFRLSGSILEPYKLIFSPLTFIKIYETPALVEPNNNLFFQNIERYGNWNGVYVPNVFTVPVTFNLLIQGYMGFFAGQLGRRTGVIRLSTNNNNTLFFIDAAKHFSIINSYDHVPVNEIIYNMPAGSYDLYMFTLPHANVDHNARVFYLGLFLLNKYLFVYNDAYY